MVYVGKGGVIGVLEYHPGSGEWSKLPTPLVGYFAMSSLNGQLVLVGGGGGEGKILRVWDGARGGWAQPYPAMPSGRSSSAAVGYQHYLIVACGFKNGGVDTVEVLDGSSRRWYSVQPVPMGGHVMSSVVIGTYHPMIGMIISPTYSLPTSPPWYPVQCQLLGLIVHPFGRSCLPLQSMGPPS